MHGKNVEGENIKHGITILLKFEQIEKDKSEGMRI